MPLDIRDPSFSLLFCLLGSAPTLLLLFLLLCLLLFRPAAAKPTKCHRRRQSGPACCCPQPESFFFSPFEVSHLSPDRNRASLFPAAVRFALFHSPAARVLIIFRRTESFFQMLISYCPKSLYSTNTTCFFLNHEYVVLTEL